MPFSVQFLRRRIDDLEHAAVHVRDAAAEVGVDELAEERILLGLLIDVAEFPGPRVAGASQREAAPHRPYSDRPPQCSRRSWRTPTSGMLAEREFEPGPALRRCSKSFSSRAQLSPTLNVVLPCAAAEESVVESPAAQIAGAIAVGRDDGRDFVLYRAQVVVHAPRPSISPGRDRPSGRAERRPCWSPRSCDASDSQ